MTEKLAYIFGEVVDKIYNDSSTIPPHFFILNEVIHFDSDNTKVELGYHYRDGKFFEPPVKNPFEDRPLFIKTLESEENSRISKLIDYKMICHHISTIKTIDKKTENKLRSIMKTAEKFMKDINNDKKFLKMKIEDLKNDKNWESGGGN